MRILHLASEYPPHKIHGLGRYVCDLSRELAAQEHEVHVLTNSLNGADRDITDRDVHVHRIDFPMPPKPAGKISPVLVFNLYLQRRSHELGRERLGNPEVIISHDYLTALAGHHLSRRWGIPHVWTVHDGVHGKLFGLVREADDRAVYEIEHWAAGAADVVLVNSEALRREMIEAHSAPASRIQILPGGVDLARFSEFQPTVRLTAFRECLASPGETLVTYVGRLDREKGIDTLINAFSEARREVENLKLAIVGCGDLQSMIEAHIHHLHLQGAVMLCGYLRGEALKHVYRVSDIHVCPSHYEPFGLVAIEAMAAGAPIIVSETGGLADIVNDKQAGFRVPPRDIQALTAALICLGRDEKLRKDLGRGARKRAEAFAWPIIARKAATLYAECRNRN